MFLMISKYFQEIYGSFLGIVVLVFLLLLFSVIFFFFLYCLMYLEILLVNAFLSNIGFIKVLGLDYVSW